MKALLLAKCRQLEVQDLPQPEVGPEDVLVRVKACGICGSDIHGYDGSSGRRIPPLVMGHEAAGVVEAVGEAVEEIRPGERVTVDSTVYCSRCHFCRRGEYNLCERRMVLGVSCGDYRRHGAFAEFISVPQHIVYRLPAEVGFEQAAIIEPMSIAFHAVNRTPIRMGDSAVVVGAGMIGLLVIQALRISGCGQIIAVDVADDRLALATELGADEGFNASRADIVGEVARRTNGRGADHTMEVVGHTATVQTAVASVREGGTVTLIGNLSARVDLPLQSAVTRELALIGSCASAGEYPACLEMLSRGAVRVEPLISAVVGLDEAPAWFERLYGQEPGLLKVLVQP